MLRKLFIVTPLVFLLAGCPTPEQKQLETNVDYASTLTRVLRYNELPACDTVVVTGCHDPATKLELKAEVESYSGAGADRNAANTAIENSLATKGINCRPDQPCP